MFGYCLGYCDFGHSPTVSQYLKFLNITNAFSYLGILYGSNRRFLPDEHADGVGRADRRPRPGELRDELVDGEPVRLPDVVEHAQRVVLHHDGVGGHRLLRLVRPALDHVPEGGPAGRPAAHVQRRHEGGRGDGGGPRKSDDALTPMSHRSKIDSPIIIWSMFPIHPKCTQNPSDALKLNPSQMDFNNLAPTLVTIC